WRGRSNLSSINGRHISLRESASFIAPLWVLIAMFALIPTVLLLGEMTFLVLLLAILLPIVLYSWRLLNGSSQKLTGDAVLFFYLIYFPARGLGMLIGAGRIFSYRNRL